MLDLDGRPHWGKRHEAPARAARAALPGVGAVRGRCAPRLDPDGVFVNDHLARTLGGRRCIARRGMTDDLQTRYEQAVAGRDAPFAVVDLDALRGQRRRSCVGQAGGLPVRVASKSLRCVDVLRAGARARGGGTRLPRRARLHAGRGAAPRHRGRRRPARRLPQCRPRGAVRGRSAGRRRARRRPDRADGRLGRGRRRWCRSRLGAPRVRLPVAVDLDTSWRPVRRGSVAGAAPVAGTHPGAGGRAGPGSGRRRRISSWSGLMAYEGQVAGVGDTCAGHAAAQRGGARRCRPRRCASSGPAAAGHRGRPRRARRARRALELVNGGGTGSLARTAAAGAVTELAAGSGLYAPTLFDTYRSLALRPAALFALPVVRRPGRRRRNGARWRLRRVRTRRRTGCPARCCPAGLRLTGHGGRRRGADPGPRRGRRRAADRRPRVVPPRQGRRAVRAVRQAAAGRGRPGRRRGADIPRRGQELRMTRADLPQPTTDAGRAGLAALLADPGAALIGLDFDGTLAPIVPDPDAARGHPDVPAGPARLAPPASGSRSSPAVRPRSRSTTARSPTSRAWWCSVTTAWSGGRAARCIAPEDPRRSTTARRRLPDAARRPPARRTGTYVEDKGAAVAVHTRRHRRPGGRARPGRGHRCASWPSRDRAGRRAGPVRARAAAGRRRQGRRAARAGRGGGRRRPWCSSATTSATSPAFDAVDDAARGRPAGTAGVQRVDRGDRARRAGRPGGRRARRVWSRCSSALADALCR